MAKESGLTNRRPMIPIRAASRVISTADKGEVDKIEEENIKSNSKGKLRLPW